MVRGKFTLQSITHHCYSGNTLRFSAIYDTTTEENNRFSQATPSGEITMHVTNPAALEKFEIGKSYYVDFTAADKV